MFGSPPSPAPGVTGAARAWLAGFVGVGVAAAVASGQGQTGDAARAPGTSTLVGVVADSLHGGPLAGAVVLVDGQSREAVTDSIGRFRIDSVVAGRFRVGIFHPVLDSLGTGVASPPLKLTAGRPSVVRLATPSGATIRRVVCPDSGASAGREDGQSDAVLVGHVLDPDNDEPVADARISLAWVDMYITRDEIRSTPNQRSTTSNREGEFRFCDLPNGMTGLLRARQGPSGDTTTVVEREVAVGPRVVTITTLHLPGRGRPTTTASSGSGEGGTSSTGNVSAGEAPATPVAAADGGPGALLAATSAPAPASAPDRRGVAGGASEPAHAGPVRAAVLTGHVERPDGVPVPGALASVAGTGDSAFAGRDGAFTIRGLPSGTHMLIVRSVGYEPVSVVVELTRREPREVMVLMATATYVLSPVLVLAQRLDQGYSSVGFTQRRREGIGQFITLDDITRRHVQNFTDLFTTTRGIVLSRSEAGTDIGAGRGLGGCVVYVIDGMPFNQIVHGELDTMMRPDELAGIEVYTPAAVPPQFRVKSLPGPNAFGVPTMGTIGCTTIVIWTKTRLGVRD